MSRQPFRRTKEDGTIDDGTGGGGDGHTPYHFPKWGHGHSAFKWYEVNPHVVGYSQNTAITNVLASGATVFIPTYSYKGGTLNAMGLAIESASASTGALTLAVYDTYDTTESGATKKGGYPKNFLGKVVFLDMDTTGGTLLSSSTWLDHSGNSQSAPTLDADTWYYIGCYYTGTSRNIRAYNVSSKPFTQFQMPLVGTWGNGWPQLYDNGQAPASSYAANKNWSGRGLSYSPVLRIELS